MLRKIPNVLTLLRVFLIPVYVIFFLLPYEWSNLAAALVFVIACFTDLLDGYLARKLQVCSKFGAFLDPVADKMLTSTMFILFASRGIISAVPVIIMVSGPIIAATSLNASATGSGSFRRKNSVIRPAAMARMFGLSSAFRRLKAWRLHCKENPVPPNRTHEDNKRRVISIE